MSDAEVVLDLLIKSAENVIEGIRRYFTPSDYAEQASGFFERGLSLLRLEKEGGKVDGETKLSDGS